MPAVKNGHGGVRPGAGPKAKLIEPPPDGEPENEKPVDFLLRVMRDPTMSADVRVKAAMTVARFTGSVAQDGKKAQRDRAAAEAGRNGRFRAGAPPKLKVV
jgi:hypothetical protein